ncbi:retinoic acid receptor responder protein 2 isoform X1 [Callorhinus ursinus]|uniref:retinoic acid receptor responder protein 2 isoform X1 n=1 Tax=Callorhinus ursinus TaxID=34884 RepID=UPI003CD00F74
MWQLLMSLALWLGAVGLGRAELTVAQQRGLQVALEEFHKHPPVQWAFKKTSMDNATETPFPAGTFVRLEFKLQQTSCRKKDWKKAECKIKPNGGLPGEPVPIAGSPQLPPCWGRMPALTSLLPRAPCSPPQRKRKCLACIKLNAADKVLGRMVHCPIHTQAHREAEEQEETQCDRVARAGEDPHSYYFPGQFAFFKALPPS